MPPAAARTTRDVSLNPVAVGSALDYAAWRAVLRGEPLPAAVVDRDAFDRNVARVAEHLAPSGHHLRLATKSLRVPDLIERVLATGKPYRGLMCYAAAEAAWWAGRGVDDLLVAYPTVVPADLALLRRVHESGAAIRLVLDSLAGIERVSVAMRGCRKPFTVVLDVDMSLRLLGGRIHAGVRRSPLRSVADVVHLREQVEALPAVRVVGLMGYEAQVAGLGDRNPFKRLLNPVAAWVRRRSVAAVSATRQALADVFHQRGWSLELFNGGGTGSVNFAAAEPWLTEVTVGSAFFCSHLFDYYSNVQFEPAAFFALPVVRSSDPGFCTCLGGGYVASGEPGWDKVPVPYLPRGVRLVPTEGVGEVQTPLAVPADVALDLGDPVLFRHAKAGELAERFADYLLVSGGRAVGRAPTYRGLGQTFL